MINFQSLALLDDTMTELIQENEIADGVFRVSHRGNAIPFILKVVNRPFYQPRDTDILRQELKNSTRTSSSA